ncbi:hypothetical protein QN277_015033 [Acacia crassicarpa]|uniref:Uncharacterized protein n=1 Tax=Acacia crassicarpa TaxID=499986 RepID=A0AAE1JWK7_9FABA|nr:hypothetical protein QN277_015033 [Acacia crassicarpa]
MIFLLSLVHYQEDNGWIRSQELMLCKEKTASRIGTYSATHLGVTLILEADALDGLIFPWYAKFAQPNGSSCLWEIAGCKVGNHATPLHCKIPLHEF